MGIIAAHQGQSARQPGNPLGTGRPPFGGTNGTMAAQPVEIIEVKAPTVACDGGPGAMGHPKVYLNLSKDRQIECPYCGRRYVMKQGSAAGAAH
jgi:uncharacterized Zn-finger protein